MFDRIIDALLLRYTRDGQDNLTSINPSNTTGSILFGAMIRFVFIIIITWMAVEYFGAFDYWMASILIVVGFVFYPAYRQYVLFNQRIDTLEKSTLCGQCKHFDPTGQLCKLYDEHVTLTHIPCNGEDWEPLTYEDKMQR